MKGPILFLTAVLAGSLFAAPAASARLYSWAELRLLAGQKAWAEILDHAEDVPADQRGAAWNALLAQAAEGDLKTLYSDDPLYAVDQGLQWLHRFETLRASRSFQRFRMEQGLPVLDRRMANSAFLERCSDRLEAFVAADPSNRELALRAGKIARRHMFAYFSVPYFFQAIEGLSDAHCADPDLQLAVVAGLGLPRSSYEELAGQSIELAKRCWGVLEPVLRDPKADLTGYGLDNLCPILREKKRLDKTWSEKCKSHP